MSAKKAAHLIELEETQKRMLGVMDPSGLAATGDPFAEPAVAKEDEIIIDKLGRKQRRGKRGRPKGSLSRKSLMRLAEEAAEDGYTDSPLTYLLNIMNAGMPPEVVAMLRKGLGTDNPKLVCELLPEMTKYVIAWHQVRYEAAKAAAPYKHARLTATQVTGSEDDPIVVEIKKFLDDTPAA